MNSLRLHVKSKLTQHHTYLFIFIIKYFKIHWKISIFCDMFINYFFYFIYLLMYLYSYISILCKFINISHFLFQSNEFDAPEEIEFFFKIFIYIFFLFENDAVKKYLAQFVYIAQFKSNFTAINLQQFIFYEIYSLLELFFFINDLFNIHEM